MKARRARHAGWISGPTLKSCKPAIERLVALMGRG